MMKASVDQNKEETGGEAEKEIIYETFLDKNGNEITIEMGKVIGEDEDGNKIELYVDKAEDIIIYSNTYRGKINKIEDNKIYFEVDLELIEGTSAGYNNVKDYVLVFDIDTYDLKSNTTVEYSVNDHIIYDDKMYFNGDEVRELIGKYVRLQDFCFEDNYIKEKYKILSFMDR